MTINLRKAALIVPLLVVVLGWAWMYSAVSHFERLTGRTFYGLAGYHYSMPEWGFKYHEGGEHVERWTVTIPSATTFAVLLVSLLFFALRLRPAGWRPVSSCIASHFFCALAFAMVTLWYAINVQGVFI